MISDSKAFQFLADDEDFYSIADLKERYFSTEMTTFYTDILIQPNSENGIKKLSLKESKLIAS